MAGEHVGEEPDGQRERPHEELRDELDRRHEDVERLRHARREERVLEVAASALLRDADDVEDEPDEQRQERRDRDARVRRHLQERDDLEDVADEDEREHRDQERHVDQPVGAHGLHDDAVADEVDRRLDDVLDAAWARACRRRAPATNSTITMTAARIMSTDALLKQSLAAADQTRRSKISGPELVVAEPALARAGECQDRDVMAEAMVESI